jgi:hypothetical protein
MNEAEWDACDDPDEMLKSVRDRASKRKLRLFACACCRRIWHFLVHEGSQEAVEAAERFADGLVLGDLRLSTYHAAEEIWVCLADAHGYDPLDRENEFDALLLRAGVHLFAAAAAAGAATGAVGDIEGEASVLTSWSYAVEAAGWAAVPEGSEWSDAQGEADERAGQVALLRDIVGPLPFRAVALDPVLRQWGGGTIGSLAEAAYRARYLPSGVLNADRLAVLADALEEAGCDNAEILSHCRGPGPHVRGCWVLDLLTGRE